MLQGRNSGKKIKTINIVKKSFSLINKKTNLNPIQVLVSAVENWFQIFYFSSPIEDSLLLGQKISNKRVSVDISPYRRISQAIYMMAIGVKKSSFKSEKPISDCLTEEILNAYKNSSSSYGIRKKQEIEKVAELNR
uniref:Small ribosomal subunit protein uS7 domain-containing protein n=1 Tax=Lotharella oceanica TaxID=641309 RepID=A0A7S2THB3_9EUKA|mmetsp:Transcript_11637/g.22396  ORF Transcript_11637/g.22396 Transcript_11637/m.22396 type:complete len:136 (+) Transcript_11637:262-669(+)